MKKELLNQVKYRSKQKNNLFKASPNPKEGLFQNQGILNSQEFGPDPYYQSPSRAKDD